MTRTVLSPSGVDMQTDALLRPSLTGCGLTTNRSWLYCATWAAGQENGRGVPGHPDLHLARERTTERAAVRSLAHSRIDKGKILSEGGPLASQATHPPRSRRSGGGPYRKGGTGADCHCRQRDTRVRDGPGRVQDRAQPEAGWSGAAVSMSARGHPWPGSKCALRSRNCSRAQSVLSSPTIPRDARSIRSTVLPRFSCDSAERRSDD